MNVNLSTSFDLTRGYNNFTTECDITPLEYLVWHALVVACLRTINDQEYMLSVSIVDVSVHLNVHKEKIRRCLKKLQDKNLAQQTNRQWIYRLEGLNLID